MPPAEGDVPWEQGVRRRPHLMAIGGFMAAVVAVALAAGLSVSPETESDQARGPRHTADLPEEGALAPSPTPSRTAAATNLFASRRRPRAVVGRCGAHAQNDDASAAPLAASWASSTGDAEVHRYATFVDHALHVIYVRAGWDARTLAALSRGGEWRASITLDLSEHDVDARSLAVEHWWTDLPDACLAQMRPPGLGSAVVFSVVTRQVSRLTPNHVYAFEIHFAAPQELEEARWAYHEELRGGDQKRFRTPPRRRVVGTCRDCVVRWTRAAETRDVSSG